MEPAAGQMLTESLMLEQRLGAGASGEVWVAQHRTLGSRVAVKLLQQIDDPHQRARFHQEARGLAQLSSPYVVQVHDVGITPSGQPFIVMELLRGQSLHERIEGGTRLSLDDCAVVITQLGRALAHAHERGVVHRDIKPANLFLVDAGGAIHLKVLDFGIAKYVGGEDLGMTSTGMMMGTPYYMSPEQIVDPKSVDERTDLWATAVVAYACLTGTVPFVGETIGALSIAINSGIYAPPSQHRPDLPAAIEVWFQRAFHRDLSHRFTSATELAEAFTAALRDSTTTQTSIVTPPAAVVPSAPSDATPPQPTSGGNPPAPPMARAPAPSRGVPVWAFALLGVVALAAVVGLGVVLTRDASSGEGADEDDRSSANASGKAKKKKKSNSKKKKNAPSTEKASPEAPKIDISALEITSAYPRFLAAAKKQRKDPQLVLITLPSVSPDSGMVMPDRAAVMRFRSGEPPVCIDVVASKGQLITSEDGCIKQVNTPIRAPRCSLPHVVKKALASVPRKPLQITYMAGADGPVWAVADSGGDGVARVPDDC